ncbi:hypothetical protein Tco_1503143 [Tanacetum coccineum]
MIKPSQPILLENDNNPRVLPILLLQRLGDENHIHALGDYFKPSNEGYRNTIELPIGNNVVPLRPDTIQLVQNGCSFHELRFEDPNQHLKDFLKLVDSLNLDGENRERTRLRTIDQSAGGKLHDRNAKESWELLKDLTLYDNESWNDPRDFAKLVNAIVLPQDVPNTFDGHLIELENQVQCLMEAHLTPTQPTQVNRITTSCEICSGPHDTQYCMEDFDQAFVEYASSHTDEAGLAALPSDTVKNPKLSTFPVLSIRSYPNMDPQCSNHIHSSINSVTVHLEQQSDSYDDRAKENEEEEKDSLENIYANPSTPPDPLVSFITKKVLKLNSFFEWLRLVP